MQHSRPHSRKSLLQSVIVIVASGICVWTIWSTATFGFSRLLSGYALAVGNHYAANKASWLTPLDPEAHFARGELLGMSGLGVESAGALEQAVALRPKHYYLWLMLGMARDQAGKTAAALLAFDEAVRLAPFYSQPRWQRGNVLLRSARYDEAFADLNLAVRSNPELAPTLIDLAWNLSKGDVKLTEQLAQIDREKMRIAFAKFLARQGKATEAVAQIRGIATLPDEVSHELLERLVAKGAFKEAFDVWQQSNGTKSDNQPMGASIYDGGFEGPLSLDEVGFGWRVPRPSQAVTMLLDLTQPHTGSKSLRIDFGGNSNPDTPLVSQLILVEPSKHYRINFAARSQDIVTGGLPLAVIIDAAGERKPLGQSLPLAKGSVDWRVWSVEFRTPPTTNGIVVGLQRENCTTSPCPIFGSIWLDSFSLEQLN